MCYLYTSALPVCYAVKEDPLLLNVIPWVSSEADIVTGVNADHREEVQLCQTRIIRSNGNI